MDMAVVFLGHACGSPPAGCTIEVICQDHDLGAYPVIALTWDSPGTLDDLEYAFVAKAERALNQFEEAVDWKQLQTCDFHLPAGLPGHLAHDDKHQQLFEKGL